jgi:hypothetical protein
VRNNVPELALCVVAMDSSLLDQARELASREAGLAVVITYRGDGSVQASVVNAGVITHPLTGEPAIGFVVQGGGRRKLANMRARPMATVVFRSGWEWVSVEGHVDLFGPDDRLEGLALDAVLPLFHEIYGAAIGGTADDWTARDDAIEREGHTGALVRPIRVYSNSPVP